jgi:hypothetical protein
MPPASPLLTWSHDIHDWHTCRDWRTRAGANARLAETIVATISRADAEIAMKSHIEAAVNKAIVQIILAQPLIAGVVVAFLKLAT